jgi:hypothetical protein
MSFLWEASRYSGGKQLKWCYYLLHRDALNFPPLRSMLQKSRSAGGLLLKTQSLPTQQILSS